MTVAQQVESLGRAAIRGDSGDTRIRDQPLRAIGEFELLQAAARIELVAIAAG